ncbi:hypothetical protein CSPX01_00669 [Colletotrichum filicis]|nr:hypothetical protein CSPX01_00669 [Colletotrichum filicis]
MGQLGVYSSQDDLASTPYGSNISPTIPFSISAFFTKGLSFQTGAVNPKHGTTHPSFVFSAVIGIEDTLEYYERFNRKKETKVAIHFPK